MCATFDDGTSKSHCWKINSLFSLILICGQVDLFIFYFHFIVIFILYFYFYFCHRWRWCLFKKRVVSSRPFSFEKNATNVLCFLMHQNWFESALFVFSMDHFFLAYIVNEKMYASHFQRKTWKSRLWLLIQKHKFCTSCRKPRPSIHYHTLSWQPKRLLGFANDDDDDDETTCSTSIFRKCDMIKKTDAQRGLAFLDFATCASL